LSHPAPETLAAFLRGELSPPDTRAVISHLLEGCSRCRTAMTPLIPLALEGAGAEGPQDLDDISWLDPQEAAAYDRAIDRALAAVRLHGMRAVREKTRYKRALIALEEAGVEALSLSRDGRYATYEALLARSQALRRADPAQARELAWLATRVAEHLGRAGYAAPQVADFRARAWGELGNAQRISGSLREAEQSMARALDFRAAGTGDPLLEAWLSDLRASLLGDQRQFKPALSLLDTVHDLYLRHGEPHRAGRALISKGVFTGYGGDPQAALELIGRGLAMIGPALDPGLALLALHNQISLLVDCGRFREARTLLWRNRHRWQEAGESIDLLKLHWLEGRINVGLELLDRAERDLVRARQGFARAGLDYHAALVALDLAAVAMRRGDTHDARALAQESADVFTALDVEREAMAALLILRRAFEVEVATAGLVDSVADFLRRVELNPAVRFEPRFLS
jgi:hypothetical protein